METLLSSRDTLATNEPRKVKDSTEKCSVIKLTYRHTYRTNQQWCFRHWRYLGIHICACVAHCNNQVKMLIFFSCTLLSIVSS